MTQTSVRHAPRKALALAVSLATAAAFIVATPAVGETASAASADIPDSALQLRYEFEPDQITGGVVKDISGKGRDGTIVNSANAPAVAGHTSSTSALDLTGGAANSTTAPYVRVPKGLFENAKAVTVSTWTKWSGTGGFQWLWCLGKSADAATFFTPAFADGNGNAQALVKQVNGGGERGASAQSPLPSDEWVNVTATMDGSTITYYLNGLAVASTQASVDLAAQLFSSTAANSGNIGRALWNVHPYYDGTIDDFRVYNQALTAEQVKTLAGAAVPTITSVVSTTVSVNTNVGTAPVLPGVDAVYSDGVTRKAPVTWAAVPAAAYAKRGTFTVQGTVDGLGTAVTATVRAVTPGELSIDLGTKTGDFLGGASGTLYGVYGDGLPSRNLLDGIKLRTVSTKAQDGPQHPGADALEIVKPVADSSNGDVYIYMTDINRGFPYEVPGTTGDEKYANYRAAMATQVDQVLQLPAEYQDNIVFVPFNEPEGNMFGDGNESFYRTSWLNSPTQYFAAWDDAYRLIKSKMPTARIAGPNTSQLFGQVKGWLEHAVVNNTVPEVITWHELSDPGSIRTNVDRYRTWEDEVFAGTKWAGKHLPINLNEYAFNYHTSVPGQMIQWISALEDKKVDGDIAYWNIDGNLSDSAVQANRGNGQWWLLNAYGQMTGQTVAVNPPAPGKSYTLQGVATLDDAKTQAHAIFGGSAGAQQVYFDNVPASFGQDVHVQVREIRWTGQVGDSGAPQTVKEYNTTVSNGTVGMDFGGSLPALDVDSAYEVILTPGANATSPSQTPVTFRQKYEAEDAPFTGSPRFVNGPEGTPQNVAGFYTSGTRNVGGIKADSTLKLNFQVQVPEDGDYDLSIFANSLNTFPANQAQGPINAFVSVDGAAEQEVYLPLAYKFVVWDHTDTKVKLTAGTHTITLAAKSLDGTKSTVGDAIVDKIELSLPNPSGQPIYEAENATLAGGAATDYSNTGVSGSGTTKLATGASATFWAYSAKDAPATLSLDTLGGGTASVTVNGVSLGSLTTSAKKTAFLSGGVNKVVVTGTAGAVQLDRLVIGDSTGVLTSTSYEAEAGTITGPATIRDLSLASGGKAVGQIGGDRGNLSTLTFTDVTAPEAGTYALTVRYSNEEQSPASHYNPDPVARHADITINGQTQRVLFPHSFHQNNFWDLTVPVTLNEGTNRISMTSSELPNFDGTTYISDTFPGILLRSKYAPNIDRITVTPYTPIASTTPTATAKVTSAGGPSAGGWYSQNVVVALTVPAGYKAQYSIDGGGWKNYSASFTVSASGAHTIDHRLLKSSVVVDGSQGSVAVNIDKVAPMTSAPRVPSTAVGTPRNPVSVTFTASDTLSGVSKTEYRVNQGPWTSTTGAPVVFATTGDYVVTYRSIDESGTPEATKSTTVRIGADVATTVKASTKSVRAGSFVTFQLAGYDRYDTVTLKLGTTSLGTVFTDVNGSGRVTLAVPAGTAAGTYQVAANGSDGDPTATVALKVTR